VDLLELKIAGLSESNNQLFFYSSATLATFPLPPSFQTFFTTFTMILELLLQKNKILALIKSMFVKNENADGFSMIPKSLWTPRVPVTKWGVSMYTPVRVPLKCCQVLFCHKVA